MIEKQQQRPEGPTAEQIAQQQSGRREFSDPAPVPGTPVHEIHDFVWHVKNSLRNRDQSAIPTYYD